MPDEMVVNVAALAQKSIGENGVRLSIENSGQPFRSMGLLLGLARRRLADPALALELGLCFDPTNPIMSGLAGDPLEELGRLPTDMLMLAHFKQCVGRMVIPTVAEGDVDFARYVEVLGNSGYNGPLVFEIPPDDEAFENLSASFAYTIGLLPRGKAAL